MKKMIKNRLIWLKRQSYWQYLWVIFSPSSVAEPLSAILELYLQITQKTSEELILYAKQGWWKSQIEAIYYNLPIEGNNILLKEIKEINEKFNIPIELWQNIIESNLLKPNNEENLYKLITKRQGSLMEMVAYLAGEPESSYLMQELALASALSGYLYNYRQHIAMAVDETSCQKLATSCINNMEQQLYKLKTPILRRYTKYILAIANYHLKVRRKLMIQLLFIKLFG